MSEALQICLTVVAVNLAGMCAIYLGMAFALARFGWHGRGMAGVVTTILVAQLFWLAPALLIIGFSSGNAFAGWAIWFGNWLVSGCGVIVLGQAVRSIPRQLEDSARLDGLGAFGIFRRTILPLVGRELWLLAILTVMATLLPFWAFVTTPNAADSFIIFQRTSSPAMRAGIMLAGSLLGALPIIAIFLFSKRRRAFSL